MTLLLFIRSFPVTAVVFLEAGVFQKAVFGRNKRPGKKQIFRNEKE
jgi:hypothetical protein